MASQQEGQGLDRSARPDPGERAQAALLRMGHDLQQQGHVNEAMDMYVQLLEDYPGTPASEAAADALMDLAEYLEQSGMPRMALNVYRILEQHQ